MGISVQTLRNYSNGTLLSPALINEETGYRYYTFDQFHIIDRIKYLRSFGLPLSEIEEIMSSGDVNSIIQFLEKQKHQVAREIDDLKMTLDDIQWYIEYFNCLNSPGQNSLPHVSRYERRQILFTDCNKEETIEDIEIRLAAMKTSYYNNGYRFRRQFGYMLDYDTIIKKSWSPNKYFIYISDVPKKNKPTEDKNILELPEGNYLCFGFRLRHVDELNTNLIEEYYKSSPAPHYVIANEHEDNLYTYTYCPYMLQLYLGN
jgi:DNA-binding transcriptional MerR regulator